MEFTQKQNEIEENYEKTQGLAAQVESKTEESVAMRLFIEDMHSEMRKLTENFNKLMDERDRQYCTDYYLSRRN